MLTKNKVTAVANDNLVKEKKYKINFLYYFYLWPFYLIYTINGSLTPINS